MVKTGVAFSDYISSDSQKRKNYDYEGSGGSSRNYLLPALFGLLIFVLFARLLFLQLWKGSYYRALSDTNRTKTVLIHAPRGIIFDRNGVPLVFNMPGYRENVKDKVVLLSREQALSEIAKGKENLEIDSLRNYPYKEAFSHVLGYLGQISKEQLESKKYSDYNSGDILGKAGIEQEYEDKLKGIDGKQLFEVDAKGSQIRKLGQQDPIPGQNITLTLDVKVQQAAYDATKNVKKGAVIVTNPKGEILALVSRPSFDPNLFTMGNDYKTASTSSYLTVSDILSDSQKQPLLDRTISGVYPPGSTFKLVVASSALADKVIDENFQVEDTGVLNVGVFSFSNWYFTGYGGKDGEVNIVKGIKRSNDIFFYKLAEKLGVDRLAKTAEKFGLGKMLGIDLQGEEEGVVPSRAWKEKEIGETWFLGDTYHYGIGQGYLLTTPLQVSAWTQALANLGTLYRPRLLKNGSLDVLAKNLVDKKSSDLIRQGMIEACAPGGVAWPLFDFKVKNPKLKTDGKNILDVASVSAGMKKVVIACKTGTAEHGGPDTKPHAWITLYAPAYNPEIVVTVLSEESGEGSNIAAPIAKKILEAFFTK